MKIIATDYDGTLNHNGIDKNKRTAIAQWRKAGNLFGVVSGRGRLSLKDVLSDKNLECDYYICNNGGVICDKDFNILKETTLEGSICREFIAFLFSIGCPFVNIDSDKSVMVCISDEECAPGEYTLENMPEITYFNQMNTELESREEAARVSEIVKERYGKILTPFLNGECIDFSPAGVNKASGIYTLLSVVGGKYEDVITVGDNINDEAMIKEFRSYAMANGVQYIKDIANYITQGITELIKKEL